MALIVDKANVPRLPSHGLRHTAATHMVTNVKNLGELQAIADVLGHSPEMLMTLYAHARSPRAARRSSTEFLKRASQS